MQTYIGVTGFMTPEEIASAYSVVPQRKQEPRLKVGFPKYRDHSLMIGILASWKSLRGIPLKPEWQKRYPKNTAEIKNIFVSAGKPESTFDPLRLIHYSCGKNVDDLAHDLRMMKDEVGQSFDGFQLNIPWPDPEVLGEVLEPHDFDPDGVGDWGDAVILQIGQAAIEMAHNSPHEITSRLKKYEGVIDGVLLDPSGGQGKIFDCGQAQKILHAINIENNNLSVGIAGGLCAETLHLLQPLIRRGLSSMSIDAEGRIRNKDGDMDIPAMQKYLVEAFEMFSR
ncbi:MAG TPA: hypothetical protein VMR73_00265 [Candidatus Paceibacterota bacterium]|nr:hypothetical protein [Candidatus Paceibacterota bacterium]